MSENDSKTLTIVGILIAVVAVIVFGVLMLIAYKKFSLLSNNTQRKRKSLPDEFINAFNKWDIYKFGIEVIENELKGIDGHEVELTDDVDQYANQFMVDLGKYCDTALTECAKCQRKLDGKMFDDLTNAISNIQKNQNLQSIISNIDTILKNANELNIEQINLDYNYNVQIYLSNMIGFENAINLFVRALRQQANDDNYLLNRANYNNLMVGTAEMPYDGYVKEVIDNAYKGQAILEKMEEKDFISSVLDSINNRLINSHQDINAINLLEHVSHIAFIGRRILEMR